MTFCHLETLKVLSHYQLSLCSISIFDNSNTTLTSGEISNNLSKYGRQMQRNEVAESLKNKTSGSTDKIEIDKQSVANSAALIQLLQSGSSESDLAKESVDNAKLMFDLFPTEDNRRMYGAALTEQREVKESRKRSSKESRKPNASSSVSSVTSSFSEVTGSMESTTANKRTMRDLSDQFDIAERYL